MNTKIGLPIALFLGLIALLLFNQGLSLAQPTDLLISEYVDGSSNNKALEIFNGTGQAIDLQAGAYNVQFYFNGHSDPDVTIPLTGTTILEAGDVFVLAFGDADPAILAVADQLNYGAWFNGDDAVVLRKGDIVLDVIGQIGFDPGLEWGAGFTSTHENTLRRKGHIEEGFDGSAPFYPEEEWLGFPIDTFDGLGEHDPSPFLVSTFPISGAINVPVDSLALANFTEPVTAADFEIRYNHFESSVPGEYRAEGNALIFTPDDPMPYDTTFSAILWYIEDLNGNPFVGKQSIFGSASNYLWEFTTEAEPLPQISFEQASYSVDEDGEDVELIISLSEVSADTISVDVTTVEGSASEADYAPIAETIVFPPNIITRIIGVKIIDDLADETDETFDLVLSNPQNATLGDPDIATVTIIDNDAPPTVSFSAAEYSVAEAAGEKLIIVILSAPSNLPITVDYASDDDTATAGEDYTEAVGALEFAPGQTTMTFSVLIANDIIDEPDETFNLTLTNPANATLGDPSSAVITILDDDEPLPPPEISFEVASYAVAEGGGSADVVVVLSSPSDGSVLVNFDTVEGSATAEDFITQTGSLSFPAGSVSQTISIPVVDDAIDEVDETFDVVLSNPQNATLGDPSLAVITILDDDEPLPLPEISFEAANYTVAENGGSADVVVVLSSPSDGSVLAAFDTVEGSATAEDFITQTGVVSFPVGSVSQTVSIQLVDDILDEADETFSVALSNAQNATLVQPMTTTVTIQDNDAFSITILINEIDSDQTGADSELLDTEEFVELYDGGLGNSPLDDYVVVFYDGSNDASYAAFDLDGFSTDANGYFALGNAAVSQAGIVFPDDLLQDGEDAVSLYRDDAASFPKGTPVTTTNLIDAIVYETGDDPDSGLLILLNPGELVVDERGTSRAEIYNSLQRCPNGSGGLKNTSAYVAASPSPGAENNCPPPRSSREQYHYLYLPIILR